MPQQRMGREMMWKIDQRCKVLSDSWLSPLSSSVVGVRFPRPKLVLSDASWNGGWLSQCMGVANHRMSSDKVNSLTEFQGYCRSTLSRHGMPPQSSLQLTAADVLAGGLSCEELRDMSVTVFASAGVRHNAVWAGDPASYDEDECGEFVPVSPGTINVMVFVNARLQAAVLPRIFTVVAEAKTNLLSERNVRSCYSSRMATGTGTDSTIVVSDPDAPRHLSTASTHSSLGMAVARATRVAIAEALDNAPDCIQDEYA
ncbi:MAG TPA: adenosylcobinamide amidohydrolase [Candidatus Angelobacter sp.]|nr:adenosylcobinamide amidohydrolase [Candidatus Angelobacter sp.]